MSTDKVFVDGMMVKRNDNAPDWVTCNVSFKASEFKAFLDQHQNKDWVNVQIKVSKGGKMYAELDTWEPNRQDVHDQGMSKAKAVLEEMPEDDIPF